MFRLLYTMVLYAYLPFELLRLLWRSRKAPEYRRRIAQRFGFVPWRAQPIRDCIWVHAVSFGEAMVAIPLIQALQQHYPDTPIVVTNTTPTGYARIQAVFGDAIAHSHLPYDLPGSIRRFMRSTRPKLAIMIETELWPNLFHYCRAHDMPVIIANARLSARSLAGYRKVSKLIRPALQAVSTLCAQSQADADRFAALGVAPDRIHVTGSIKFDVSVSDEQRESIAKHKVKLSDRPIWVAASTHEAEESIILDCHQQLLKQYPSLLLIWAPRHPERFAAAATSCTSAHLQTQVRSEDDMIAVKTDTQVLVADTMGELWLWYGLCDVAFVGGSLAPIGGHNILEPAAMGKAIVTGNHTHNFVSIITSLSASNAIEIVATQNELSQCINRLLSDHDRRKQLGDAAMQVVNDNKGALGKQVKLIEAYL